jgi:hypothetical protein
VQALEESKEFELDHVAGGITPGPCPPPVPLANLDACQPLRFLCLLRIGPTSVFLSWPSHPGRPSFASSRQGKKKGTRGGDSGGEIAMH